MQCAVFIINFDILSAYQVNKRHHILEWLIVVKEQEVTSYNNMNTCVIVVTACTIVFAVMEVIAYFLYLCQV